MSFPQRLVLATRNPGKVREVMAICGDWPVAWLTHEDVAWPDVAESGSTYLDNARLKAHGVAGATGVPALGEDSGIEVDALGGAPGPRSARYAGEGASDRENVEALLRALRDVPPERRTARYRAVAVVAWPDGSEAVAEGTCEGRLWTEPAGTGGFGYDPIFQPAGRRRTLAQLDPGEKDAISHRGAALRALRDELARR